MTLSIDVQMQELGIEENCTTLQCTPLYLPATHTHWVSFLLIPWRLLVANFISVKPVLLQSSIDVFWIVHLPDAKQWIFNCNILIVFFLCYQLISEHFGECCTTLWLTVATLSCIKLCAFFSEVAIDFDVDNYRAFGTPCNYQHQNQWPLFMDHRV